MFLMSQPDIEKTEYKKSETKYHNDIPGILSHFPNLEVVYFGELPHYRCTELFNIEKMLKHKNLKYIYVKQGHPNLPPKMVKNHVGGFYYLPGSQQKYFFDFDLDIVTLLFWKTDQCIFLGNNRSPKEEWAEQIQLLKLEKNKEHVENLTKWL